jgi:hypothetical protein
MRSGGGKWGSDHVWGLGAPVRCKVKMEGRYRAAGGELGEEKTGFLLTLRFSGSVKHCVTIACLLCHMAHVG